MKILKEIFGLKRVPSFILNKKLSVFSKAFHKKESMDDYIHRIVSEDSDEDINAMFREARISAAKNSD